MSRMLDVLTCRIRGGGGVIGGGGGGVRRRRSAGHIAGPAVSVGRGPFSHLPAVSRTSSLRSFTARSSVDEFIGRQPSRRRAAHRCI